MLMRTHAREQVSKGARNQVRKSRPGERWQIYVWLQSGYVRLQPEYVRLQPGHVRLQTRALQLQAGAQPDVEALAANVEAQPRVGPKVAISEIISEIS